MAYILIIDDDEDYANATAKILKDAGYEVDCALEVKDSIRLLKEKRPDLLILDVMFPESSTAGFELARVIRDQHENVKTLPILMITSINQEYSPIRFSADDIDDAWLPVTDFVEKPVSPENLRNKVASILAKKDAECGNG